VILGGLHGGARGGLRDQVDSAVNDPTISGQRASQRNVLRRAMACQRRQVQTGVDQNNRPTLIPVSMAVPNNRSIKRRNQTAFGR
jgi:hypothetical protein